MSTPPSIPSTLGTAAPTPEAGPTEAELLAPFEARIEPIRASPAYRLGLLFVVAAMLLLPAIYLGLIALTAYGVWHHMTANVSILRAPGGGNLRGRLLAYLTPIVVGAVGVAFMVKPLFAPRAKRPPSFSLDPRDQPTLFRFVERLCRSVRAPMPRRIDVDNRVNASASFRDGLLGLARNDLVLTVGLPLVVGLDLRQLTGVLAHEFGHFAQGGAIRLTYIIRAVNAWFARVVFERDAWDEALVQGSQGANVDALKVVLYVARAFVWLSRRILWVLMWAGHVISCFMLRQMEYDADRYEARVAGSETFARTAEALPVLTVAHHGAMVDLRQSWQASRLADDFPGLVAANVEQLRAQGEIFDRIRKGALSQRTGLFDTHPSDADRIASAARERAPGLFDLEAPARVLFRDFDGLCKAATLAYYRETIPGASLDADHLVPTATVVSEQAALMEGRRALDRYFRGVVSADCPIFPDLAALDGPPDPAGDEAALAESRRLMVEAAEALKARAEGSPEALDAFRRAARGRLESALRLLRSGPVFSKVVEAQSPLAALDALRRAWPVVEALRDRLARMNGLFAGLAGKPADAATVQEIRDLSAEAALKIAEAKGDLNATPYPFDHGGGPVSIGAYLAKTVPDGSDIGAVHEAGHELLNRAITLYLGVLASVVRVAESVEAAIGLPPLPGPEVGADPAPGTRDDPESS